MSHSKILFDHRIRAQVCVHRDLLVRSHAKTNMSIRLRRRVTDEPGYIWASKTEEGPR